MIAYNKEQSIKRLNDLSSKQVPFVFVIDYNQSHSYIEEVDAINPDEFLFDFNGFSNIGSSPIYDDSPLEWNHFPISFEAYNASFRCVKNHLLAGNSFLTNLTCETPIETNLSLKTIFHRSQARYKLWINRQFVVFSPEIFIRIHDGQIHSYPMKGTIKATTPQAKELLMNDVKEQAEHATIVDLIRNDLSMVATQVTVDRYRYVETLQTNTGPILQTSSDICGQLPDGFAEDLGNLLFKLLPAGSITGAPKHKTTQIIAEAETYQRGFYTGVMGYFDGRQLDSAVMIRFIEERDGHFYFKSGGGITFQSEALSEYNEMKQKVYVPIC